MDIQNNNEVFKYCKIAESNGYDGFVAQGHPKAPASAADAQQNMLSTKAEHAPSLKT